MDKDYYGILELGSNATQREIKDSYRSLARRYHPDLNQNDILAEKKFKQVIEAYFVLSNDIKKREYDKSREINNSFFREVGKKPPNSFSNLFGSILSKIKYSDVVSKSVKNFPQKGDDIIIDLNISITEAHKGTFKKISLPYKKISIKIPPNTQEGAKIQVKNKGTLGENGGENGDIYFIIHIKKHSLLEFDELNVLCEIPVTPSEAAIGAKIEIPTLEGQSFLKIPPETYSGQIFRLLGQGIFSPDGTQKGDQIITIKIEIPKNLSIKEKQLYNELSKVRKFNPRENIIYDKSE